MEHTITAPAAHQLRTVESLPGPRPWPLAGNLPNMQLEHIHRSVEAWSKRYGPMFKITLGRTPMLVLAGHELVNAALRDRPDGFRRPSITAQVSDEMGGLPGLFLAEGAT